MLAFMLADFSFSSSSRPSTASGPRRTSSTTLFAQCSLPDLDRRLAFLAVFFGHPPFLFFSFALSLSLSVSLSLSLCVSLRKGKRERCRFLLLRFVSRVLFFIPPPSLSFPPSPWSVAVFPVLFSSPSCRPILCYGCSERPFQGQSVLRAAGRGAHPRICREPGRSPLKLY